jgi:hypothetical protein
MVRSTRHNEVNQLFRNHDRLANILARYIPRQPLRYNLIPPDRNQNLKHPFRLPWRTHHQIRKQLKPPNR